MSIFDPFLSEFSLMAKLLLQSIWQKKTEWDQPIGDDDLEQWNRWLSRLTEVSQISAPRCYGVDFFYASVELHILCDASELAYAAVGYWRIPTEFEWTSAFIMEKTKCALMKLSTVPRLELQAAVLGVRLRNTILQGRDVQATRVCMWSDSKTVLAWIRSDTNHMLHTESTRFWKRPQSTNGIGYRPRRIPQISGPKLEKQRGNRPGLRVRGFSKRTLGNHNMGTRS
ncbi:uncharacterized protein [Drosophila takahashii]|uniref:uncharacterized protein n=1 Tax=Drosophila takahashii TaxID=29030 RepID=UPI003899365B